MKLAIADWAAIVGYLAITLALYFMARKSRQFGSLVSLPWRKIKVRI